MTKEEYIEKFKAEAKKRFIIDSPMYPLYSVVQEIEKAWDAAQKDAFSFKSETYDPVNYPSVTYHK